MSFLTLLSCGAALHYAVKPLREAFAQMFAGRALQLAEAHSDRNLGHAEATGGFGKAFCARQHRQEAKVGEQQRELVSGPSSFLFFSNMNNAINKQGVIKSAASA